MQTVRVKILVEADIKVGDELIFSPSTGRLPWGVSEIYRTPFLGQEGQRVTVAGIDLPRVTGEERERRKRELDREERVIESGDAHYDFDASERLSRNRAALGPEQPMIQVVFKDGTTGSFDASFYQLPGSAHA